MYMGGANYVLVCRKDDYAFFLQPVDTSQIPGYLDLIKTPMDFGTITQKVERGRYRSLEEFTVSLIVQRFSGYSSLLFLPHACKNEMCFVLPSFLSPWVRRVYVQPTAERPAYFYSVLIIF